MDGERLDLKAAEIFAIEPLIGLKRHEEIDDARARTLLERLGSSSIWTTPLLVDAQNGVILDGHHRFWCATQLGLEWIPTFRISYESEKLELLSWRSDVHVTCELVIEAGMSGKLLPKKTSRHIYSASLPDCAIPIDVLRHRQAA